MTAHGWSPYRRDGDGYFDLRCPRCQAVCWSQPDDNRPSAEDLADCGILADCDEEVARQTMGS